MAERAVCVTVSSGPGGEKTIQVRAADGVGVRGMSRDQRVSEGFFVPVR